MEVISVVLFVFFFSTPILASPRIIGGDLAKPGQFPFIAALHVNIPDFYNERYGSGSILNNQWIVTAAHCLLDLTNITELLQPSYLTVLVGSNQLDTGGIRYNAKKLIKHERFDMERLEDDIGLIKIDGIFEFTDLVQVIAIDKTVGNDLGTIIGWGITEDELTPNDLRYLYVRTLFPEECETRALASNKTLKRGPGHVCVLRGNGFGACSGDSGGPMIHHGKLVGVISYSLNLYCAEGLPDVYTRVEYYKEWIENMISSN